MRTLLALVFVLMGAASASAQIVNPQTLDFPASADHSATFGAQPIVEKYEALVVRQSATGTVLYAANLLKPTPSATAIGPCAAPCISVPMPLSGTGGSAPNNTLLQVAIRTTGPGGASTSVLSDPFGVVGPPAATGKPIPRP
jgi:hypothetical protein